jgi:hypothetical protein
MQHEHFKIAMFEEAGKAAAAKPAAEMTLTTFVTVVRPTGKAAFMARAMVF